MLDLSKLTLGLEGRAELVVGEQHTAPRIGSGRVHVLAVRRVRVRGILRRRRGRRDLPAARHRENRYQRKHYHCRADDTAITGVRTSHDEVLKW